MVIVAVITAASRPALAGGRLGFCERQSFGLISEQVVDVRQRCHQACLERRNLHDERSREVEAESLAALEAFRSEQGKTSLRGLDCNVPRKPVAASPTKRKFPCLKLRRASLDNFGQPDL